MGKMGALYYGGSLLKPKSPKGPRYRYGGDTFQNHNGDSQYISPTVHYIGT